jgi:hypothetical protein
MTIQGPGSTIQAVKQHVVTKSKRLICCLFEKEDIIYFSKDVSPFRPAFSPKKQGVDRSVTPYFIA